MTVSRHWVTGSLQRLVALRRPIVRSVPCLESLYCIALRGTPQVRDVVGLLHNATTRALGHG